MTKTGLRGGELLCFSSQHGHTVEIFLNVLSLPISLIALFRMCRQVYFVKIIHSSGLYRKVFVLSGELYLIFN